MKSVPLILIALLSLRAFVEHALAAAPAEAITYPLVSENTCPAEVISVRSPDGNEVIAVMRKPPGNGPFPVMIHLHGGLGSRGSGNLKEISLTNQTMNRFLAAGYVTVNATFRSREKDPQTRDALLDCLAVVEHVKKMPQADPRSIVLWGDSGGGSLALELAGETDPCAATAQEPATVLFTGMFNTKNLGEPGSPDYKKNWNDIMARPRDFYTPELEKFTVAKIAKIHCPILIAHGDRHAINKINNEIIVPALKAAGKPVEVILYPGEGHGFSSHGTPAMTKKFFDDADAFFRRHLATQPRPLDRALIKETPVAAGRRGEKPTRNKQASNGVSTEENAATSK